MMASGVAEIETPFTLLCDAVPLNDFEAVILSKSDIPWLSFCTNKLHI